MKREQASRVATAPCHLKPPLKLAWTLPGDGVWYGLPLIEKGLAFMFDQITNRTIAMDEATWEIRWEAEHYFSVITNEVGLSWRQGGHVVDLRTGTVLESISAGVGYEKAALGERLVVLDGDDQGQLIRVTSLDHRRDIWQYRPAGHHPTIAGIFCADERAVYLGLYDTSLVALSLDDGRLLWRQDAAAELPQALKGKRLGSTDGVAIAHGDVVIFRFGPNIAGLSALDGRVVWSAPIPGTQDGYLYDGRYYTTTSRGEYHVLDPLTGKVLLSADLMETLPEKIRRFRSSGLAPILVSETHLFVGTPLGFLLAFERDTGRYTWSFRPRKGVEIHHRSPGYFASANGRLYYADVSPALYCLEEATPTDPVLCEQRGR